jgi:predicted glycosyltransferase
MNTCKIVAYGVNGSGLGHLTRLCSILRWLKRYLYLLGIKPQIYLLTSSEGIQLATQEGIATFKIPSKTVAQLGKLVKEDYLRLARQWIWHSIGLINPDLLIVDTFPCGTFGELYQILDSVPKKVLILRSVKPEFAEEAEIYNFLPYYNRIIIPKESELPPVEFTDEIKDRLDIVGPIFLREREELLLRSEARKILGIPEGKQAVWLSAGGGGDSQAEYLLNRLAKQLESYHHLHLVIGAGILYRGTPIRGGNITWLNDPLAVNLFPGIDWAISAAGFNSYYELLHVGVPTAFYSQSKTADDQQKRLDTAVRVGAALALDDIDDLVLQMKDDQKREELSQRAKNFVPRNYAKDTAKIVTHLLAPKLFLEEVDELLTIDFCQAVEKTGLDWELVHQGLSMLEDSEMKATVFYKLIERMPQGQITTGWDWWLLWSKRWKLEAHDYQIVYEAFREWLPLLLSFNDDNGVRSFLRLLPLSIDKNFVTSVSQFLETLLDKHESLWRGLSVFHRYWNQTDANLSMSLQLSIKEIKTA